MAPLTIGELDEILIQVLSDTNKPVSVSLINTTLLSLLNMSPVTERFLIDNRDTFLLQVVGSDLKISLRSPNTDNGAASMESAKKIFGVIENDIRKMDSLKETVKTENKKEIVFNDFINKYSSRKRPLNMGFIIRNSNSIEIFRRNNETYVRFVDNEQLCAEIDDKEVFDILKLYDFSELLKICLKSLLTKFSTPVQLGSLQSSFSLGHSKIDKQFLHKYKTVFQGDGTTGIELRNESSSKQVDTTANQTKKLFSPTQKETDVYISEYGGMKLLPSQKKFDTSKDAIIGDLLKKNVITQCEAAMKQGRSFVMIGESLKQPIIQYVHPSDNVALKLNALKSVQESIVNEIKRLKEE